MATLFVSRLIWRLMKYGSKNFSWSHIFKSSTLNLVLFYSNFSPILFTYNKIFFSNRILSGLCAFSAGSWRLVCTQKIILRFQFLSLSCPHEAKNLFKYPYLCQSLKGRKPFSCPEFFCFSSLQNFSFYQLIADFKISWICWNNRRHLFL